MVRILPLAALLFFSCAHAVPPTTATDAKAEPPPCPDNPWKVFGSARYRLYTGIGDESTPLLECRPRPMETCPEQLPEESSCWFSARGHACSYPAQDGGEAYCLLPKERQLSCTPSDLEDPEPPTQFAGFRRVTGAGDDDCEVSLYAGATHCVLSGKGPDRRVGHKIHFTVLREHRLECGDAYVDCGKPLVCHCEGEGVGEGEGR